LLSLSDEGPVFQKEQNFRKIRIPVKWEPHSCCWMAWVVHCEWGKAVKKLKQELSEVVHTIAEVVGIIA